MYLSPSSSHKSTRSAFFFFESHMDMFTIGWVCLRMQSMPLESAGWCLLGCTGGDGGRERFI